MIGVVLFQNVKRIHWEHVEDSAPAFIVLFFIPFTYSIVQGVILGYVVLILIGLFTGKLKDDFVNLVSIYYPRFERTRFATSSFHVTDFVKHGSGSFYEEDNENGSPGGASTTVINTDLNKSLAPPNIAGGRPRRASRISIHDISLAMSVDVNDAVDLNSAHFLSHKTDVASDGDSVRKYSQDPSGRGSSGSVMNRSSRGSEPNRERGSSENQVEVTSQNNVVVMDLPQEPINKGDKNTSRALRPSGFV